MKSALIYAITPAVRTFAQTLAGSLGALAVAQLSDFKGIGELAVVLLYGAVLSAIIAYFQNFAESLPDHDEVAPPEA